ncbi:unnamed protein product [Moneuplotes crassus]|uniref:Uncharacterized protein n=1 Tax=Euplotes crassus TaxID=5936 RepID=A0AAD1XUY6_EUPCR|nr:unnamed protein product [Moneuplotes crassus]
METVVREEEIENLEEEKEILSGLSAEEWEVTNTAVEMFLWANTKRRIKVGLESTLTVRVRLEYNSSMSSKRLRKLFRSVKARKLDLFEISYTLNSEKKVLPGILREVTRILPKVQKKVVFLNICVTQNVLIKILRSLSALQQLIFMQCLMSRIENCSPKLNTSLETIRFYECFNPDFKTFAISEEFESVVKLVCNTRLYSTLKCLKCDPKCTMSSLAALQEKYDITHIEF